MKKPSVKTHKTSWVSTSSTPSWIGKKQVTAPKNTHTKKQIATGALRTPRNDKEKKQIQHPASNIQTSIPTPTQLSTSTLLHIGPAAKYLKVSIDTLRRWEKAGKIRATRTPGGTRVYAKEALERAKLVGAGRALPFGSGDARIAPTFSISEAAKKLGVSTKTLRRWDKEGKLSATRNEKGQRVYSEEKLNAPEKPGLTASLTPDVKSLETSGVLTLPPIQTQNTGSVTYLFNQTSQYIPNHIKTIFLTSFFLFLVSFLLTSTIVAGYLVRPQETKQMFGSSTSKESKPTFEVSQTVGKSALKTIRTNQQTLGASTSTSNLQPQNPSSIFHLLSSTILSPFNSLAQNIIQAFSPTKARDLGFYQQNTDNRFDLNERAILEADDKIVEAKKEFARELAGNESKLLTLDSSLSSTHTTSTNLLRNSSFEANPLGQPDSWFYVNQSTKDNTFVNNASIRSGNHALRIEAQPEAGIQDFGFYQPFFTTKYNRPYTLSLYLNNQSNSDFTLKLGFWDKNNNKRIAGKEFAINEIASSQTPRDDNNSVIAIPSKVEGEAISNNYPPGWKRYTFTLDPPDQDVTGLDFYPMIEVAGLAAGSVFIDDVQLEEGVSSSVYHQEGTMLGDGSIFADVNGNFYPTTSRTGSLGTNDFRWGALYLTKASIDKDGNTGLGGNLSVAGTATITSNLAVDGGTLSSASSTFSLLDTNVITLTIGGTATSIGIGAPSGTTTINNNLSITGNIIANSPILLPDGSFSAPSLSFTNDPNSGLYRLGSDTIGLITGGTLGQGITINSSGNVGIGTTGPNNMLQVAGAGVIGSDYGQYSAPANGLLVQGNVGLGSTGAVGYGLDVWGTGRISSAFTVGGNIGVGQSGTISSALIAGSLQSSSLSISGASTLGTLDTVGNVGIGASASITGLTYALGGLRVNGFSDLTGNVGVGGTAVFNSLMVASGNILPSANNTYDLGSDSSRWRDLYLGPNTLHLGTSTSDEYTMAYDTTNNRLGFNVNGSGPAEIVMDVNGYVGIGTTNPLAALHVVGDITNPGGSESEKFGSGAIATGTLSLAVGYGATTSTYSEATAIGHGANVTLDYSTAVGFSASATRRGVALGNEANASGQESVALGRGATSSGFSSIALGYAAIADVANTMVIGGGTGNSINTIYFGHGRTYSAPTSYTLQATGGSGTDITGGTLQLAGGMGTGTGAGGPILFSTSAAGTTGTTLNSLSERMRITSTGNVGIGNSNPGSSLSVSGNGIFGFGGATSIVGPANGLGISGNLGIGTTSPNNKLQIIGGGVFGTDYGQYSAPANGLLVQGNVGLGSTGAVGYGLDVWGTGRITSALTVGGNIGVGASVNTSSAGIFGSLGTSSLAVSGNTTLNTLTASGNVGIGASSSITGLTYALGGLRVNGFSDLTGNVGIGGTASFASSIYSQGSFYGINGSATAPAYSFTNLTNSGLWTNGDGLLLTTDGSNTSGLTVTGAGNVGIGLTNPTGLFQVATTTSQPLYVSSNGNVGIGTTNPEVKFHVVTSSSPTFYVDSYGSGNNVKFRTAVGTPSSPSALTTGYSLGILDFAGYGATSWTLGKVRINGVAAENWTDSAQGAYLGLETTATGGTSRTEKMRLYGSGGLSLGSSYVATDPGAGSMIISGNVGIGTTTANSKLSVIGGAHIGSIRQGIAAPTDGLFVDGNVGIGATTSSNILDIWGNSRISGTLAVDSTGTLGSGLIGYSGVTAPTSGLAIAGNLGIGTTSPNNKLQVIGAGVIGSDYGQYSAPANGLLVQGNVGLGSTGAVGYGLDVWGTGRITSALTVGGNIGVGASVNTSSAGIFGSLGTSSLAVSGNTTLNTLTASGNVGIGASSSITGLTYALGGLRVNGFSDLTGNVGIGGTASFASSIYSQGSFYGINGSATAPAYSFTNLTNSGLWTNGDGLLLTTDGSNTSGLTVTGAGNVGIGLTNPTGLFQVATTTSQPLYVSSNGNVGIGTTSTSQLFQINSDTSNPVVITSGGNVGIGTTSPGTPLHIYGTSTTDIRVQSTNSGGVSSRLQIYNDLNQLGQVSLVGSTASGSNLALLPSSLNLSTTGSGGLALITTSANAPMIFATGGTGLSNERMRINSSGNVGIGTTAPAQLFQVSTGLAFDSANNRLGIGTTTPLSTLSVIGGGVFGNDYAQYSAPANGLLVQGNVGLGSTGAVGYGLDVWGTGRITSALTVGGNIGVGGSASITGLTYALGGLRVNGFSDLTGNVGIGGTAVFNSLMVASGNIIPSANNTYDLGSDSSRWRDLYLGPNTLHLGTSTSDEYTMSYDTSNNSLGFNINGSGPAEITFDSSGNVGIGTSVPHAKLSIQGNVGIGYTGVNQAIPVNGLAVLGNIGIGITTANSNLSIAGNAHIGSLRQGISAPTDGLFVDGNVGIGATTAAYNLDVWGTGRVTGALTVGGNVGIGGTATFNSLVSVSGNIIPSANNTYDLGSDALRWRDLYLGPGTLHLGTSISDEYTLSYDTSNNSLGFNINGSGPSEITFDSLGNVGIGTSVPHAKLSIQGNVGIGYTGVNQAIPVNGLAVFGNIGIGTTTSNSTLSVTGSAHIGSIRQGIAAPTDGLFVDGNVGIGATTSSNKLDVWGNSRLNGTLTVDGITSLANTLTALPSTGFIGIGTTSPNTALHLLSSSTQSPVFKIENTNADANPPYIILYKNTASAAANDIVGIFNFTSKDASGNDQTYASMRTTITNAENGSETALLRFDVANAGSTDTIMSLAGGNVGIGTDTTPDNLFSVGSTSQFQVNSSGYALLPDGAAGTPALSFTGDTNTGIYRLTDDTLRLTTAGSASNGLTINSSGNIGIGTTTPNSLLSVAGGAHIGSLRQGISAPTDGLFVDGNVGIGATTAAYNLDVWGTGRVTGALTVGGNVGIGGTATFNSLVSVSGNIIPSANNTYDLGSDALRWRDLYLGPGTLHLGTSISDEYTLSYDTSNNSLGFNINGSGPSEITFDSLGNVGIGTSVPHAKLSIQGNVGIGYTGVNQAIPVNGLAVFGNIGIGITTANSNLSISGNAHIGSIWQGITAPTDGLFVDGNVGIGATTSSNKLDVWGTGRITGTLTADGITSLANTLTALPSTGFIGIGTTSPNTALHLLSSSTQSPVFKIENTNADANPPYIILYKNTASATANDIVGIFNFTSKDASGNDQTYASMRTTITNAENGSEAALLRFDVANAGSADTVMSLYGGNVGIGTDTTPDNLFSVGSTSQFQVNSSGYALLPDGAASTPSLSFTGDTNTGMYRLGDDILRLTTAGSATAGIAIAADGNVGIGTTTANSLLSVAGGAHIGSVRQGIAAPTDGLFVDGNVGVGATTSSNKLDVWGNSRIAGTLTLDSTITSLGGMFGYAPGTSLAAGTNLAVSGNLGIGTTTASTPFYLTNTASTGTIATIAANALTSGTGFNLTSTSTAFSSGFLANLDWSPTTQTTATGSLLNIGIGASGMGANFLNLTDAGSSVFSISKTSLTTSLPTSFTAAGDVAIAYDINMTNPTASYIKSQAPLYLQSGEVFNSSDLTLQTYNSGNINLDPGPGGLVRVGIGSTAPFELNGQMIIGKDYVGIGRTAPQNGMIVQGNVGIGNSSPIAKFQVNQTGASSFTVNSNGNVGIGTSTTSVPLTINNLGSTTGTALVVDAEGQVYKSSSSERYKDNIQNFSTDFNKILEANPKSFNYKATGARDIGFTAEDFNSLGLTDLVIYDGQGRPDGIKYDRVGLYLLEVVKSQQSQLVSQGDALSTQGVTLNRINGAVFVADTGNVGIGTTDPGDYKLYVNGPGYLADTGWTYASDQRLKENIDEISTGLDVINALNPITFDYINGGQNRSGFIAQEVANVLPSIVSQRPDGMLSLRTDEILPYAVKAIQELNDQIAKLSNSFKVDEEGNLVVSGVRADKLVVSGQVTVDNLQIKNDGIDSSGLTAGNLVSGTGPSYDLASALQSQESRVKSLEEQQASQSARLATLEAERAVLAQQTSVIASVSEAISNLNAQIASLSAQLTATQSASPSATMQTPIESGQTSSEVSPGSSGVSLHLTPPEILLATTSAQLVDLKVTSEATISGKLTAYSATISDTFKSFGKSFLGDTVVAGDFSIDGTMSITGNAINSINTLYIQNNPLSSGVDFFNGAVTIDKAGKLLVQKIILPAEVLGEAVISRGLTEIPVFTNAVTEKSKIFLTPLTSLGGQNLIISGLVPGSGFVVTLDSPLNSDIKFNWLIIDTK